MYDPAYATLTECRACQAALLPGGDPSGLCPRCRREAPLFRRDGPADVAYKSVGQCYECQAPLPDRIPRSLCGPCRDRLGARLDALGWNDDAPAPWRLPDWLWPAAAAIILAAFVVWRFLA